MSRILACSDIHGEDEKLADVLDKANYNPRKDQLILLGDYIDRGSNSKRVVEHVIELVKKGAVALFGNHEDMLIRALESDEDMDFWLGCGGKATLDSYDGNLALLKRHASWMCKHLKHYYETDDYIFVHANLNPETPMEWQDEETMLWGRSYERIGLGKIVVHGHTSVDEVWQCEDQLFIDTGACSGGALSLVELPSLIAYKSE